MQRIQCHYYSVHEFYMYCSVRMMYLDPSNVERDYHEIKAIYMLIIANNAKYPDQSAANDAIMMPFRILSGSNSVLIILINWHE